MRAALCPGMVTDTDPSSGKRKEKKVEGNQMAGSCGAVYPGGDFQGTEFWTPIDPLLFGPDLHRPWRVGWAEGSAVSGFASDAP